MAAKPPTAIPSQRPKEPPFQTDRPTSASSNRPSPSRKAGGSARRLTGATPPLARPGAVSDRDRPLANVPGSRDVPQAAGPAGVMMLAMAFDELDPPRRLDRL